MTRLVAMFFVTLLVVVGATLVASLARDGESPSTAETVRTVLGALRAFRPW